MTPRRVARFRPPAALALAVSLAAAGLVPLHAGPAAAAAAPPSGTGAARIQLPPLRDFTLPNGARILLSERHDVPLVAFSAYLRGGSLTDPEGKEGVAALTAEMLRKGAGKRNAREIAEAADGVGGNFGSGVFLEGTWVAGDFLKQDVDLMIDLLSSVLRAPTFPDSEFTKLRSQTAEAIVAAKEDPGNVYRGYGVAYFYGAHPYGRPLSGDEATVASLTRDDVLRCYRDQFGGDRLILAVVGDFAVSAMEAKLRAAFGDWKKAAGSIPAIPEPERVRGRRVLLVDKPDATQTYFWIGNRGVPTLDPDRVAIDVANTAFGGTFGSILNTELRIKSGLTYSASCRVQRLAAGGSVGIGSFTKTENTAKAIDLTLATLGAFRASGLDGDRVARSRNFINGQAPTDLETAAQISGRIASNAFYGLPREEITEYPARVAAVDSATVRSVVARVYPPESDLVFVLVGNAASVRAAAKKYGRVTEISLSQPMIEALRGARADGGPTAR
jgi:predicted Zn-dependent peptidase